MSSVPTCAPWWTQGRRRRGCSPARASCSRPTTARGAGWSDAAIAGALDIHSSTVQRIRRQFVVEGLVVSLARKRPDRVYERALDGRQEAHLIALACSQPPDGHARWSLRLLAGELVRLEVVETVSHEAVRQTLKKTTSSHG